MKCKGAKVCRTTVTKGGGFMKGKLGWFCFADLATLFLCQYVYLGLFFQVHNVNADIGCGSL